VLTACASSYRGPVSGHFDGARFHNDPPERSIGVTDLFRWWVTADSIPWPRWEDWPSGEGPSRPRPAAVDDDVRVTFVNHSTMLVQMDGVNILTDPVWSDSVGPTSFLGPKRHHAPGVRFVDLPHIDAVTISHDHYDHLDLPTLERLTARDAPLVIAGLGTGPLLASASILPNVELDWWQCRAIRSVTVCALPARHHGLRSATDANTRLWASYWISGAAGSVFVAGDTAFGGHFEQIRARMGAPCVALLPIGAYLPRWFMKGNHMNPDDAVRAHDVLGPQLSIAMHFATFKQSDEGMYEPAGDLGVALSKGRHAPFIVPRFGEETVVRCARAPASP
jgi:L-ascorbate metabolism protein UlaG (beta-lactamase superfamily)